jgi:hypothetical protein
MAVDLFFRTFDTVVIDEYGLGSPYANLDVEFYNVTQAASLEVFTTDDDGIIPAGGFDSGVDPVAAGDVIEMRSDGTMTRQFKLSASAAEAVLDPDAVVTYVAEDLTIDRESAELFGVFLEDLAEPDKKPVYLGDAKADGSLVKFPYRSANAQSVRLRFNPKVSTVKTEFADPSLRASETLSIPGASIRPLADFYTDTPTSGTTLQSVYDADLPANLFVNPGDTLFAEYIGFTASNGNSKSIIIDFNSGETIFNQATTANNKAWELELMLMKNDAAGDDELICSATLLVGGVSAEPQNTVLTGLDFTAVIPLILQLHTATASGDLTARAGKIWFMPAAPVEAVAGMGLEFLSTAIEFGGVAVEFTP